MSTRKIMTNRKKTERYSPNINIERYSPKLPTEDRVRMADFALKNNFFKFNGEVKRQKSGMAIGTKFPPPYPCIFMDEVETEFGKWHSFCYYLSP